MNNSELKKITNEDLKFFENLETFVVELNELRSLPSNLFEGLRNLKCIEIC